MQGFLLCAFMCMLCHVAVAQPVMQTMKRLPDTGETISYTNTPGEDADYSIYPPYFIVHGNGTATDSVTGLMWQQTDGGEMTVERATIYCDTLTLGGYTDWRLPNAHELFSILNHQNANPALNTAIFPVTGAEYWWSSNRQWNDSNKVWCTNSGGGIGNHPKSETISAGGGIKKFHVRAVRDVTPPTVIPNHFTGNTDGTVTDNITGLIWQQVPRADSLTWEGALTYADTLTWAGYTDWRLPNIKELQSINDESRMNPSVHPVFTGMATNKYWSSTTLPNHTTWAWYLYTQFGITTYDDKLVKHKVICVRGPGSVLPIKITGFTALLKNGKVELKWSLAEAANLKTCLVERSLDGRHWTTQAAVPPTSKEQASYFFIDQPTSYGSLYYRIKFLNKDEECTYSAIEVVKIIEADKGFMVFPNPTRGGITIAASNYSGIPGQVTICSSNGTVVCKSTISRQLVIPSLGRGVYTVHVASQKINTSQMVIVR